MTTIDFGFLLGGLVLGFWLGRQVHRTATLHRIHHLIHRINKALR